MISSTMNYKLNKHLVFNRFGRNFLSIRRYFSLAIGVMAASSIGTALLFSFIGNRPLLVKIFVDVALFSFSYVAQRDWVFVNKELEEK